MPKSETDQSRSIRRLEVTWRDAVWSPVILQKQPAPRFGAKSLLSRSFPCHNRLRRFSKPMNINTNESRRFRAGFTLVELLTVIAIIAILAAMLLPVLAAAKKHAQVVKARLEIGHILQAIQSYNSDYGRFPISKEAQAAAEAQAAPLTGQFTFGGTTYKSAGGTQLNIGTPVSGTSSGVYSNDAVMAILMDMTNYPNTTPPQPTANASFQKNPRQIVYLTTPINSDITLPGVGPDLVFRDPWGNPYIITIDLNDDNKAEDWFYGKQTVSNGGLNGLIWQAPDSLYAFHGNVMVWSAGPDGKADLNTAANAGVNKDNVVSWQ